MEKTCSNTAARIMALFCVLVMASTGSFGAILTPGTGWTGATAQPAQIGSGAGAGKYAIAHWDMVPFQTFADTLNVGILAYHFNDIDSVCFSVNNGPWLAVRQATLNPETGVEEYWVTLRASLFAQDGREEVRAIAYPKIGIPKVLQGIPCNENSSMLLNANSHGTMPHVIRYVSITGHDSNNGQTPALACSSIAGAIIRACTGGSAGGSVDGAEIRLGQGSWSLPDLGGWARPVFATTNQWLTFTAAPGADPDKVIMTGMDGAGDGIGLNTKLVRLYNLCITGGMAKASVAAEDYIWFDHAKIYDSDPTAVSSGNEWQVSGWGGVYSGVYFTDCYYNNMCNGPRDATFARNVYADTTGGGHSSGTATVINYTVNMVYGSTYKPGWPDFHGDVYQMYGRHDNIIIYGARTVSGSWRSMRGIVGSTPGVSNVAIVNCDIEKPTIGYMWVFSYCSPVDHMVVKNSRLIGSSNWCGEGGTLDPNGIQNVLIDHSVFENGNAYQVPYPYNLAGIRYVPALGTAAVPLAAPINFTAQTLSSSQIKLTWNDIINESGYKLERSSDGTTGWALAASPNINVVSYTDNSLTANTTYYYRLRAWNTSGDGAWSAVVSAATSGSTIIDRLFGPAAAVTPADEAGVTVYDAQGKIVFVGRHMVRHQALSRGVYFVKTPMGIYKMLRLD
jgi:hypothetical protein